MKHIEIKRLMYDICDSVLWMLFNLEKRSLLATILMEWELEKFEWQHTIAKIKFAWRKFF